MDNLASLHERINQAVAEKIIGKIINQEARHHFNHGWKTRCPCSVCKYRRNYAAKQSLLDYTSSSNFNSRKRLKELNRAFKREILEKLS